MAPAHDESHNSETADTPISPPRWRRFVKRTRLPLAIAALLLISVTLKPGWHLWRTRQADVDRRQPLPAGMIDDASRLNATQVAEIWRVAGDDGWESQVAALLKRARATNKKVCIAGARHSMGGHVITPEGVLIDTSQWNAMELDSSGELLHVQAGATWSDILPYLDTRGKSVGVMQSNSSFSVGGSISVNCHGWQLGKPPIASTVESFRLMTADGGIHVCSRNNNSELFSLALGGYGLFGVILDVSLRVTPNRAYRLEQAIVPVTESLSAYQELLQKGNVDLAYARMNIVPDQLFDDVIVNVFYPSDAPIPSLSEPGLPDLRRSIFRGSAQSDYGKELRWTAETKLQPWIQNRIFSRNQLFNEGVEVFQNRSNTTTDILHEYFVPPHRVAGFVQAMRYVIQSEQPNLLNVTVRSVQEDHDSFLRYADQSMYCFVMLFVQQRDATGERRMQTLTRRLIDAALRHEGRYYLPYRLHATQNQFHAAYPQAREFFAKKRQYDPEELFDNQFYRVYSTPRK